MRSGGRHLWGRSRDTGGLQPLRLRMWKLGLHCHDLRWWDHQNHVFIMFHYWSYYHEMTFATEKTPVLETDEGHEMTEEEWTRRVAELNKHQVNWLLNLIISLYKHAIFLYKTKRLNQLFLLMCFYLLHFPFYRDNTRGGSVSCSRANLYSCLYRALKLWCCSLQAVKCHFSTCF